MLFDVNILVLLTIFYDLALTNVTVCCIWKWFLQHSIFEQCGKILCFLIIEEIWWENFNKVNLNTVGVFSSDLFFRKQACSFVSVVINEWSVLNKLNKPELQRGFVDSRFVRRHVMSAFTKCPLLYEKIITICPRFTKS